MEKQKNVSAEITKEQAYQEFQQMLMNDPKLMAEKQKTFEQSFGKDTKSRTRKQWANLVRVYGMDAVCDTEKMSKSDVEQKCNETFSQRIARINRIRQTIK